MSHQHLHSPVSWVWQSITDYRQFGEWFRVKQDGPFVPEKVSRMHITYPGSDHLKWEDVSPMMCVLPHADGPRPAGAWAE